MDKINFRKHPFRGIFTEIADEQNRLHSKALSAEGVRLAYRRGQPEALDLVTAKIQQRLTLTDRHYNTTNAVHSRPYL